MASDACGQVGSVREPDRLLRTALLEQPSFLKPLVDAWRTFETFAMLSVLSGMLGRLPTYRASREDITRPDAAM